MYNLAVKNFFGKAGLWAKKNSPELCIAGMIICGGAAIVAACKETLKADDILEEHSEKMEKIHKTLEDHKDEPEVYSEEDMQKDTCIQYAKTTGKLIKIYAPAAALFVASMAFGCASFGIMKKRNAEIAATAASTLSLFNDYRQRVVDKYGEDIDKELRYGIQKTIEEEETVTDENGKEKKVKEKFAVDLGKEDYTTRYFVKGNPNWSSNPSYREIFINGQINYMNDIINSRGFVSELEALDALGFDISVHKNDSEDRKQMLAACSGKGWVKGIDRATDIITFESVRIPDEFGNYQQAERVVFHIDGDLTDLMK